MILIDGKETAAIPADDRGLTYGDGVFRTLVMRNGDPRWWPQQYAKLAADCQALKLAPPPESVCRDDLRRISRIKPDCVVRITITRGSGGRGYAMPIPSVPRRIVSASDLPETPAAAELHGARVRYCKQTLGLQPALAGIKHLNRLENVLARAEWSDPDIVEGLLCDSAGNVIAGTRSNVFIVENEKLVTPDLAQCGVAGVTRELIMASAARQGVACRVENIPRERLEAAACVLLVNSVIEVWPVAQIGSRQWRDFNFARRARKWLDEISAAAA